MAAAQDQTVSECCTITFSEWQAFQQFTCRVTSIHYTKIPNHHAGQHRKRAFRRNRHRGYWFEMDFHMENT